MKLCPSEWYQIMKIWGLSHGLLGKYGRRMDPCAKIEAGAQIHVSGGMVRDVTVMKYEENG